MTTDSKVRFRHFLVLLRVFLIAVTISLGIPARICAADGEASRTAPVGFNRDIRPILSDNCFSCHGFDKNKRDSGLRLDVREEAIAPASSKRIAIVPGKPEESELIARIFTDDEDDVMPPPKAHKTLTAEQKQLIKRWIAEGAVYEPHWAYVPLAKPSVPTMAGSSTNPVDAFVAKSLAEHQLTPAPSASPAQLMRRLALDLVGLPPSVDDVAAFVKAYETDSVRAVAEATDRLLKSPHYGERWAVWWLDAVRFADTVGFHGDQAQRIFPFRDYVIDAFNANKRFDTFTLEQIAGDLLPEADDEQLVASGFNRLSMMTREGGVQAKEFYAKYMADRVRAVGSAWLGSTVGCAECHDHKFDPIKQKDFYALGAYFADIKQFAIYHDLAYTPVPELRGWTDHHPFPPEVEVANRYRMQRRDRFREQMSKIAVDSATRLAGERARWQDDLRSFLAKHPSGWLTPTPVVETRTKGVEVKNSTRVESNASVFFSIDAGDEIRVMLQPGTMTVASLRLQLLPRIEHGGSIVRTQEKPSMKLQPVLRLRRVGQSKPENLAVRFADADRKGIHYFQGESVPGITDGWRTSIKDWNQPHSSVWLLANPVALGNGDVIEVALADSRFSDSDSGKLMTKNCVPSSIRVSVSPLAHLHFDERPISNKLIEDPQIWLTSTGADTAALTEFAQAEKLMHECLDGRAKSLVTQSVEPAVVRILPRGNWQDDSGEVVKPTTLSFIPELPEVKGRTQNRIDLARWLTSKENPLPPRALMNRLWKQFFGTGLSAVLDDLGAQGEPPRHPELLDWLASEFRDSGWDFQHMVRIIVTSKAYQQSSRARPELREIDPANRLLAAQIPRRLDAEFIRDNALSIAGLINLDIGGPSFMPYQPADLYRDMEFPKRIYNEARDDRQWRRGLYMHWQRTFLHPMLANFDAPNRDESACARNQANTPQQALTLLNDPTFLEAARIFAQSLLKDGSYRDDTARLDAAFQRALARLPTRNESIGLLQLLASHRQQFLDEPTAAARSVRIGIAKLDDQLSVPELAAWTSVCRVILNLHETITRY